MSVKYKGTYKCGWYRHKFEKVFGKIHTVKGNQTTQGVKGITSAVKCPNCDHNLKPEKDAIKIEAVKEEKKR